jgi:hypothetical protein
VSTLVQFQPSTVAPFTFQPTLSGAVYSAVVTWNAFGERYYLNLYDLSGNLILCRAVSSAGPQFQGSLSWDPTTTFATATTTLPHQVPVGQLANVWVSETGTPFDGAWQGLSTSATTLTFSMPDPEQVAPVTGVVSFLLNLIGGLGLGWLVFHYASQQFEFETTLT